MWITVIGTQCVGKSTLIKDFIKENPRFITPTVDYRTIITENNLQLNRTGNYRSQKFLFDFIKNQTVELANKKGEYILDRSLIDVVAYSLWLVEHTNTFTKDQYDDMYKTMTYLVSLYDSILYNPLHSNAHVSIQDDKFRDTDPVYREEIDHNFEIIINALLQYKVSTIHTIYGDRVERINMIKNIYPNLFKVLQKNK